MINGNDNIHEALEKIAASGLSSAEISRQSKARRVRARKEVIRRLKNDPLAIRADHATVLQRKGYSGATPDPVTLRLQRQYSAFGQGAEVNPTSKLDRGLYNKPGPAGKWGPGHLGAASARETRLVEEVLKNVDSAGRLKGRYLPKILQRLRLR